MSELLTYGSVGGGGRKPAPYPALDAAMRISLHIGRHWRGASDVHRWVPMRNPRTITLMAAGVLLLAASSAVLAPTTILRPVRGAGGEVLHRPDGGIVFEHDTLGQLKHDWLSVTTGFAGLGCLLWSAARGIRFLVRGRTRNYAA